MRKVFMAIVVMGIIGMSSNLNAAEKKGGIGPACVACCIGPRVGLQMNDGKPVESAEWLRLVWIGAIINDVQAYQKNGCVGCLLENFLGPRVGRQYNKYNVRTMEWLSLIISPIPQAIAALDAYNGKTWSQIVQQEHLQK